MPGSEHKIFSNGLESIHRRVTAAAEFAQRQHRTDLYSAKLRRRRSSAVKHLLSALFSAIAAARRAPASSSGLRPGRGPRLPLLLDANPHISAFRGIDVERARAPHEIAELAKAVGANIEAMNTALPTLSHLLMSRTFNRQIMFPAHPPEVAPRMQPL